MALKIKKCKGVTKNVRKRSIQFGDYREAKLNEYGILHLDLSSGDGTHWVMWFKKGRDQFYFDSYGVQPPSELIAYLKSPIFYNSE